MTELNGFMEGKEKTLGVTNWLGRVVSTQSQEIGICCVQSDSVYSCNFQIVSHTSLYNVLQNIYSSYNM